MTPLPTAIRRRFGRLRVQGLTGARPAATIADVRVLVVDDNAAFRDAARELLEGRGHTVAEARDGHEAFLMASRFAPQAALIDLKLDVESGVDVAQALTRSYPDIAVVLMSADRMEVSVERLRECGARGFVRKERLSSTDLVALLRASDN